MPIYGTNPFIVSKIDEYIKGANNSSSPAARDVLSLLLSYNSSVPIAVVPDLPAYNGDSHAAAAVGPAPQLSAARIADGHSSTSYAWKQEEVFRSKTGGVLSPPKGSAIAHAHTHAPVGSVLQYSNSAREERDALTNTGWHFPFVELCREDEQMLFDFQVQFKLKDR
jgi:hypothetical protein